MRPAPNISTTLLPPVLRCGEKECLFLSAALDAHKDSAPALAIKLLMHTGARKSEILGARWEHVDCARRVLTISLSKSGKARHIPLSDSALEILRQLPQTSEGWLFPSPLGNGHLRDIHHFWRQIRRDIGLENVRIHDLRHSFASFLVGMGHMRCRKFWGIMTRG